MVSIERLHELFRLDAETGKLYWKIQPSRSVQIGFEAGGHASKRYRQIGISGRAYYAHRIIWAMTHGRWPTEQVDHINETKCDNRPENLREANNSENHMNCGKRSNNTSGFKGVTWVKSRGKWQAQIKVLGKAMYLGRYSDIREAKAAYERAAIHYHGAFANAAWTR